MKNIQTQPAVRVNRRGTTIALHRVGVPQVPSYVLHNLIRPQG